MSIFRRTFTRYHDASGKQVPKSTPGAKKAKERSKEWYGRFRDRDGIVRQVRLSTNKEAARQLLADYAKRAELGRAGMVDPHEKHHQRPLADHLTDFRNHLQAKGATGRYADETFRRVKAIVDGCGFRRVRDIQASKVELWLAEQRGDDLAGMSPQTCNHYITAAKRFLNWLIADRRTSDNPLKHVSKLNADTDVRRRRRCLTVPDFDALFHATLAAKESYGLAGRDRAMLYLFAAYTGLRASELASLTPKSLDLSGPSPAVTVEAGSSKRRKRDVVPLNADLAKRVQLWLNDRDRESRSTISLQDEAGKLWPGEWAAFRHGARMLKADLELAGIAYDVDGEVFDFHALRHQFISMMAAAGVHPKTAQELARHSDINLTMNAYSHVRLNDMTSAVDSLPQLGRVNSANAATGTTGFLTLSPSLVTRKVTQTTAIPGDLVRRGESRQAQVDEPAASPCETAGCDATVDRPTSCDDQPHSEKAERTRFELVKRLPVYRISNPDESCRKGRTGEGLRITPAVSDTDSDTDSAETSSSDPMVAELVARWSELDGDTRQAILALSSGGLAENVRLAVVTLLNGTVPK